MNSDRSLAPSLAELTSLRSQLEDMKAAVDSIRKGGVDAIMIGELLDERVYTLASADRPYRVILDEMGEGAATVSERGILLYTNQRFASLLGADSGGLVGTDVTDLVSAADRPLLVNLLSAPAGITNRGEINLVRSDGTNIAALSSATGLDVEGILVRCLIVADHTEWHRTEQELAGQREALQGINAALAMANAELGRSNLELEIYASAISHDLREPLRTTAGFVDLIRNRYLAELPDGVRGLFTDVVSGIARMEDRITTILNYARSGSGIAPPHPVDTSTVLELAVKDVDTIVRESGTMLKIGRLPVIDADAVQLQRVFQNLLTNAVLHRNPDVQPVIDIDAERLATYWQFTVMDNGPGVPMRARNRIFQMFSRGSSVQPGHGMGLALCRRIVESYGGTIWVEDNPAGGSRFCFTLPARDGDKAVTLPAVERGPDSLNTEGFRALFWNIRDGVMITKPNGQVYAANPAMCAMFGRTESEICAQDIASWVDPADLARWWTAVAELQRTGHCELGISFRRPDGRTLRAELTTDVFDDSYGGKWAGVIVRDIADQLTESAGQHREAVHVAALQDARQQADTIRRIAVGVNDDIVQALVAAEMTFDLGRLDEARQALAEASRAARSWVGVQLFAAGEPEPGSLVRTRNRAAVTDGTIK